MDDQKERERKHPTLLEACAKVAWRDAVVPRESKVEMERLLGTPHHPWTYEKVAARLGPQAAEAWLKAAQAREEFQSAIRAEVSKRST